MVYRLALLSPIPVVPTENGFVTLDLWAVDLAEQLRSTPGLTLVCPRLSTVPSAWSGYSLLPDVIRVIDSAGLQTHAMNVLFQECDVVQVFGGQGWRASRLGRKFISQAKWHGITSIVGLSSNRARTALMNTTVRRLRDMPRAIRGLLAYCGLRANYWWLTSQADGTFIVGDGIRSLVAKACPSLHVGIASWIRTHDIVLARTRLKKEGDADLPGQRLRKLCIASRLEPMKGVHVGIDALALLRETGRGDSLRMTIFGAGAERARLGQQVTRRGLKDCVVFGGTLAYPDPFLSRLGEHGIVALSNLNDEQPRLIFDAISMGCIPVYPRTRAYVALGLPSILAYEVGNASSMAAVLAMLCDAKETLGTLHEALLAIAERYTLESMHAQRAQWIMSLLDRRSRQHASKR